MKLTGGEFPLHDSRRSEFFPGFSMGVETPPRRRRVHSPIFLSSFLCPKYTQHLKQLETSSHSFRYFLTIVYDCSKFTWVYLLHSKSDAQQVIPQLCGMISTQFGVAIKNVRSDNAKELNLPSFYASKGVIHFHSC